MNEVLSIDSLPLNLRMVLSDCSKSYAEDSQNGNKVFELTLYDADGDCSAVTFVTESEVCSAAKAAHLHGFKIIEYCLDFDTVVFTYQTGTVDEYELGGFLINLLLYIKQRSRSSKAT
ncbi:hypothetical protein KDA23_07695 [Candidatus Saccharibacteria bacterium]|nr:hypothetical protein [Candidatus Saccharibacteria bacterium]